MEFENTKVAIIGLGYVGLPLAVEFGKFFPVVGFDISLDRVNELSMGLDKTLECSTQEISSSKNLIFSADPADIAMSNVFIVTVPTPVDSSNRPDLNPLISACKLIGSVLKVGDVVIFESTVYPGCTEEICVPILELNSGLVFNLDFSCGYSPERINPGDKTHRLSLIKKVTSGSNHMAAKFVDELYRKIILVGTHLASSIKVAEAAKIIENTQRDLNIALMNELSLIFHRLNIDTLEVLEAAGTKWNFLPFKPGLVGGHCIGVDPYYLTDKAEQIGYHPEVILAGRRINDGMGAFIADEVLKLILVRDKELLNHKVLVLGLAFKENCPDIRNTKVIDLIQRLNSYGMDVEVFDPWIDSLEAEREYGLSCLPALPSPQNYGAIILAVGHDQFREVGASGIKKLAVNNAVFCDVKGIFPKNESDYRL